MIKLKTGKLPYVRDSRDLKMSTYLMPGNLPVIPPSIYTYKSFTGNWGMMGNDRIGDCVFAGACHETMLWNSEAQRQITITDQNAIDAYSAVTGYNPNNPNSDQGTDVRTALKYRQTTGIKDSAGIYHKLSAYMQINDLAELKAACFLFNAVGLGIQMPNTAQKQFMQGKPWDVVCGAKIEGGHYISIMGFDADFIYVSTWAAIQKMTYRFFQKYSDEIWALLSMDFLNSNGMSPQGFDYNTLLKDLTAIKAY